MDNVVLIFITLMASTVSIICIRYNIRLRNYLKVFIETSKQISNREFHSRLNIDARGELGELSKNFNDMIDIMNSKNRGSRIQSSSNDIYTKKYISWNFSC